MLRNRGLDVIPAEVGFRRHQVAAKVPAAESSGRIDQACQYQNPCKEEMKGPVPYRGTDDERNRQVNERPGSDTTGFSPVQARMRDENADAAGKQADNATDANPVGHTNKYGVRRRPPFVRHVDHSEVRTDSTASDRAG